MLPLRIGGALMGPKYETERKGGGGLDIFPVTEYVVDKESGERVGELTRWQHENAGDKIADGEWTPYDSDDD